MENFSELPNSNFSATFNEVAEVLRHLIKYMEINNMAGLTHNDFTQHLGDNELDKYVLQSVLRLYGFEIKKFERILANGVYKSNIKIDRTDNQNNYKDIKAYYIFEVDGDWKIEVDTNNKLVTEEPWIFCADMKFIYIYRKSDIEENIKDNQVKDGVYLIQPRNLPEKQIIQFGDVLIG